MRRWAHGRGLTTPPGELDAKLTSAAERDSDIVVLTLCAEDEWDQLWEAYCIERGLA